MPVAETTAEDIFAILSQSSAARLTQQPSTMHQRFGTDGRGVDIQASTALWATVPNDMAPALDAHHCLIRKLIRKYNLYEVNPTPCLTCESPTLCGSSAQGRWMGCS